MKALLTILILGSIQITQSQSVTLAWDASPSPGIVGYAVHYGTNAGQYGFTTNVGLVLTQRVAVPHPGRWFFAVTAIAGGGLESVFSNEVQWQGKPRPPVLHGEAWVRLTPIIERSTNLVDWTDFPGEATWLPATNAMEFFAMRRLEIERALRVSEP